MLAATVSAVVAARQAKWARAGNPSVAPRVMDSQHRGSTVTVEVSSMAKTKTMERTATAEDRAPKTSVRKQTITDDDVARRAYSLYLERGGGDGHDVDDWTQAVRELRGGSGNVDD